MTQSAAIVGIGCRFPGGANSPEEFWRLLRDGVEAISEVPSDRFDVDSVFDPDPARKGTMYTRRGGFVEEIDKFDAAFFGFSPREASRVDPQHRLLLEIAYEAVEDAGMSADRIAGTRTGVFVGYSAHDYSSMQMYPFNRHLIDSHSMTGGASSIAANRISYMLDLRGPSFIVDTACSSALTAVHLAMRSLRNGECDLALAGGAQLNLTPEISIGFCKASMISPDGRCHAFDARANGYVRGEGGGLVLLKPLDAALADGDRIYAVLVGTGINQDGGIGGMTVPSAVAQEEMLRAGLADAGLEPSAVQYAEAHGTGTPVGDPIEAAALGAVFGSNGDRFPIGSVKTNIGHLEAAAGAAGLIKSALALHHGEIPPSLNFEEPSPDIDFDALALRVVTELEPWPSNGAARTATINSFGFGGANANAVLQEAPRGEAVGDTPPAQAGPYSCRSRPAAPRRGTSWPRSTSSGSRAQTKTRTSRSVARPRAVAHITTSGSRLSRKPPRRPPRPSVWSSPASGRRRRQPAGGSRRGLLARVRLLRDGAAVVGHGPRAGRRGARLRQGARALRRDLRAPRGVVAESGAPARTKRLPMERPRWPGHQRGRSNCTCRALVELGDHPRRRRRAQRRRDRGRARGRRPHARGHDAPRLPPKQAPGPDRRPGQDARRRVTEAEAETLLGDLGETVRWRPSTPPRR